VIFKPKFIDDDIRQDGIRLMIPGLDPLFLTATGVCIPQPEESVETIEFTSLARKTQEKSISLSNPTDKDWFITPSLEGDDWKVANELKVPAKGAADLKINYFPLTMTKSGEGSPGKESISDQHNGQIFIALPDGTARLYKLVGTSGAPTCSGELSIETTAKKAETVVLKVENWLHETTLGCRSGHL
jgi:hypothetical protein